MRMMIKGAALLIASLGSAAPAIAETVTKTYSFRASDFTASDFVTPVPRAVVTGRFSVTFDDQTETSSTTAGVTLLSLNIALGSPLAASYVPAVPFLGLRPNFQVGGSQGTVNVVTNGTDDFFLEFGDVLSGQPVFRSFNYAQQGVDAGFGTLTGSVTSVAAGAVPEPAAWAFMILGFGVTGAALRRRHAVPVGVA